MPSIPEYTSRENSLTPSSAGASAWEQAGRRIGPLYNEAATFREREGRLAAEAQRQRMWPFDILRLYQSQASQAAQGGSGFKVVSRPGGATGNASDFDVPRYLSDGWTPGYNDLGQVSRGAAAIGNAVADGGYGVSRGGKPAAPGAPGGGGGYGEDYTLVQGQFVSASDARKIEAQDRADQASYYKKYGEGLNDYYSRYYGYTPNPDATENKGPTSTTFGGTGGASNMNPYTPSANSNPSAGGGMFQGLRDYIDHSSFNIDYSSTTSTGY